MQYRFDFSIQECFQAENAILICRAVKSEKEMFWMSGLLEKI